jgi:NADPH:quinone reductase-like Zn-dependent oxidoreductase
VLIPGSKFVTISGDSADGSFTPGSFMAASATMTWRNDFGTNKHLLVMKESGASKLKELAALVDEGKLKPVIDEVYPWTEVHAVFAKLMSGRVRGKVVIRAPVK